MNKKAARFNQGSAMRASGLYKPEHGKYVGPIMYERPIKARAPSVTIRKGKVVVEPSCDVEKSSEKSSLHRSRSQHHRSDVNLSKNSTNTSARQATKSQSSVVDNFVKQCERLETCKVLELAHGKLQTMLQTLATTVLKNRDTLTSRRIKRARHIFMMYGWKITI